MYFWFSLDYFVLVLFAFVVLDLVSSVLWQEIGSVEHLRNDLFCVEWAIKTWTQSIIYCAVLFATSLTTDKYVIHK